MLHHGVEPLFNELFEVGRIQDFPVLLVVMEGFLVEQLKTAAVVEGVRDCLMLLEPNVPLAQIIVS